MPRLFHKVLLAVGLALTVCAAPACATAVNQTAMRDEARDMFMFGFRGYMQHAFPHDDLRPLSCRGHDTQGGFGNTLVDVLDTLVVMGAKPELQQAVAWAGSELSFDIDKRVHVFELTIRALGGLLSAHALLEADPSLVPGYGGGLLRAAVDLADRLMPAFDTPTRIPLSWVNLRRGVLDGELRQTCTACATTLLLEFGYLSHLSGDASYGAAAAAAARAVFGMRSRPLGLPGNTLDCDSGHWVRLDSGIGAGADSYYEYLLKAYLLFGDEQFLRMFAEAYASAMGTMQLIGEYSALGWLVDVHAGSGRISRVWISSLAAFWPGMQGLIGDTQFAGMQHGSWMRAWRQFGWLPELFDIAISTRHPLEKGYPLRPELAESTFLLHAATGDDAYLKAGRELQDTLAEKNRGKCGYASVSDVASGVLEDTMESFFLSETAKYLFLLGANATGLPDFYVLTTEGHLLPPLPASAAAGAGVAEGLQQRVANGTDSSAGRENAASDAAGNHSSSNISDGSSSNGDTAEVDATDKAHTAAATSSDGNDSSATDAAANAAGGVPDACAQLCKRPGAAERRAAAERLQAALPLLRAAPDSMALLRQRRCRACIVTQQTVASWHPPGVGMRQAVASGTCPADRHTDQLQHPWQQRVPGAGDALEDSPRVQRQLLCRLHADPARGAQCRSLHELRRGAPLSSLPPDSVVLQVASPEVHETEAAQQEEQPAGSQDGQQGEEMGRLLRLASPQGDVLQQHAAASASFGPVTTFSEECWAEAGSAGSGEPGPLLAARAGEHCSMTGTLALAEPRDACSAVRLRQPSADGDAPAGQPAAAGQPREFVALLDRGGCSFVQKVLNAQAAGARAVIVANNEAGGLLIEMGADGSGRDPVIPALGISADAGAALRGALAAAAAPLVLHIEPPPPSAQGGQGGRCDAEPDDAAAAATPAAGWEDDAGTCSWDPAQGGGEGSDETQPAAGDVSADGASADAADAAASAAGPEQEHSDGAAPAVGDGSKDSTSGEQQAQDAAAAAAAARHQQLSQAVMAAARSGIAAAALARAEAASAAGPAAEQAAGTGPAAEGAGVDAGAAAQAAQQQQQQQARRPLRLELLIPPAVHSWVGERIVGGAGAGPAFMQLVQQLAALDRARLQQQAQQSEDAAMCAVDGGNDCGAGKVDAGAADGELDAEADAQHTTDSAVNEHQRQDAADDM